MNLKKIYIFFFLSVVFAQTDINQIRRLSNSELDVLKEQIQSQEIDVLKEQIQSQEIMPTLESNLPLDRVSISPENIVKNDSGYFGYQFFEKPINFFDNIPTPENYILGPGDQLVLSLWGEENFRTNFGINKDGQIFIDNLGFISLSNKTLTEAQDILKNELVKIYSTLGDSIQSTKLKLELGQLKSLNIFFTGHVNNPGINLVHPFSDIFSAIVQSGGISESGSLRKIQLIRNNQLIHEFDFYNFFVLGLNDFSNIKLIDNDIIHIPPVSKRIKINGATIRTGFFEILDNETLFDGVEYAGGFSSNYSIKATLKRITSPLVRSSEDNAFTLETISVDLLSKTLAQDGDELRVIEILGSDLEVSIMGQVKRPGKYPAGSLKDVLDLAGGFNDPIFQKSISDEITILRRNNKDIYSDEFEINYENSSDFQLIPSDIIIVYSTKNYSDPILVEVVGQVNQPGFYQVKPGQNTIKEIIALAGGLTELGDLKSLYLETKFGSSEFLTIVRDIEPTSVINSNSKLSVGKLNNYVRIVGNVYNPSLISFKKNQRLKYYINGAGGLKKSSAKRDIYIVKSNGRNINPNFLTKVEAGDTIYIPRKEDNQDFDITNFLSDLTVVLTNIAAILVITK